MIQIERIKSWIKQDILLNGMILIAFCLVIVGLFHATRSPNSSPNNQEAAKLQGVNLSADYDKRFKKGKIIGSSTSEQFDSSKNSAKTVSNETNIAKQPTDTTEPSILTSATPLPSSTIVSPTKAIDHQTKPLIAPILDSVSKKDDLIRGTITSLSQLLK